VSERTVFRRLANPTFRDRLSATQAAALSPAYGMLTTGLTDACRRVTDLVWDPNPHVGFKAAKAVVDLTLKMRDQVEVEDRVTALERITKHKARFGEYPPPPEDDPDEDDPGPGGPDGPGGPGGAPPGGGPEAGHRPDHPPNQEPAVGTRAPEEEKRAPGLPHPAIGRRSDGRSPRGRGLPKPATPCHLNSATGRRTRHLKLRKDFARAGGPVGVCTGIGGCMSETDTALVLRAREGDRAAFEELIRRTSRLVFARLYLDTGSVHRAEDLCQETLLLAYRSLRRLTDPARFRPWLLAIAGNVLIDATRRDTRLKRAAPPPSDTPLSAVPAVGPSPDEAAEREELRGRVLAVLRSLPEEYRLPITLRYITGADYDTIGLQLGLTNGSLRGLLHRGLKMLRDRLPPDLRAGVDG
ncbi:MAG: polymerase sigma factor, sigma-70 family, partial [Gemmataceae bacterium]|nr:polymerase sigma factor, sigma-70 family [Gemmataceae bacterium]